MFALALDTSSPAVTAAIVTTDLELVAARTPVAARGHGELLTPSIAEVLAEAGLAANAIGAIVAGTGPGPFTGLRVGLVTAAALAHALDVPAYGVCSLDAIGALYPADPALLVATDARRKEVYWARYAHGRRVGEPEVARPADMPLDGLTSVAGPELHDWPGLDRRPAQHPDPVALVRLAQQQIAAGAPSDPLTPLYLRRPDAVVPGTPKAVRQ